MPDFDYQPYEWHLKMCKVREAWQFSEKEGIKSKGEGVVIAHMDTGWTKHPEIYLNPNYLRDDPNSVSYMDPVVNGVRKNAENPMSGSSIWFNHGTSTASVMIGDEYRNLSRKMVLDKIDSLGLPEDEKELYISQMAVYFSQIGDGINDGSGADIDVDEDEAQDEEDNVQIIGVAPRAKVLPIRATEGVIEAPGEIDPIGSKLILANVASYFLDKNTGGMTTLAKAIDRIVALIKFSEGCEDNEEDYKNVKEVGVISISLGGPTKSSPLEEALKEARRNGIITCAAGAQLAGNMSWVSGTKFYPGCSPHTARIAGAHEDGSMPMEGFYGEDVDFTAPGWGIRTAVTELVESGISFKIDENGEGTSHSTAVTAGICALWLAHHGRENLIGIYGKPLMLDAFLYCVGNSASIPEDWDRAKRGSGIINAEELLNFDLPEADEIRECARISGWEEDEFGNWEYKEQ